MLFVQVVKSTKYHAFCMDLPGEISHVSNSPHLVKIVGAFCQNMGAFSIHHVIIDYIYKGGMVPPSCFSFEGQIWPIYPAGLERSLLLCRKTTALRKSNSKN